jgi:RNA polymerase sigma-70 factor, ECF subfamily
MIPMTKASDAQLVEQIRSGSLDALGKLYERHADAVYRAAWRILGTAADAEDVMQDTFVGLPLALARYQERGSFEAWLRTIAVRSALMRRRRSARGVRLDDVMGQPDEGSIATSFSDADPIRRIAIERAIAALPDPLRIVFMLREVEGYSHAEIGTLIGTTATASAIRLHRAWKQIRKGINPS